MLVMAVAMGKLLELLICLRGHASGWAQPRILDRWVSWGKGVLGMRECSKLVACKESWNSVV